MPYQRRYMNADHLNQLGSCHQTVIDYAAQCTQYGRTLRLGGYQASSWSRFSESCYGLEDSCRRLYSTAQSYCGVSLCGTWANDYWTRISELYNRTYTCTQRLRGCIPVYQGGGDVIPEGAVNWGEIDYLCGQVNSYGTEYDYGRRDCRRKCEQVQWACGTQIPVSYREPINTYVCQYPAYTPTTYTCRYPSWCQDPRSVSWIGRTVCYGQTGFSQPNPCPTPSQWTLCHPGQGRTSCVPYTSCGYTSYSGLGRVI